METYRINGEVWRDTDGNVIHAHGGCILRCGDVYYWYGENRLERNYVNCYRSRDLLNWEFRRSILTMDSPAMNTRVRADLALSRPDGGKINIERPKVLYNQLTGKYVLWAHYENGTDYRCAAACVATCDTPDGAFVYHGSFNPFGQMSRDCTLFADVDGTVYFISAARDNADLHIYRLSEDLLNVASLETRLWPGEYREAPALFTRNGKYYMLTSFCTGWHPNQGKYAVADAVTGRWSMLRDFGDNTTFHTQPAYVLPEGERYLYIADRWDAVDYHNSRYVFLELHFDETDGVVLEYTDRFR